MIKKFKRANSLVEVLIVLGIISTTMIASVSVIVKNVTQLKINEIEDGATSIMIQGLEIAKTPTDVVVDTERINTAAIGTNFYYSLTEDEGINLLQTEEDRELITECPSNSIYQITTDLNDNFRNLNVCLQIKIIPLTSPNGERYYEITSRIVYQLPNQKGLNTVKGFRYESFISSTNL